MGVMKINLDFQTKDCYDNEANVKYNGILKSSQEVIDKLMQDTIVHFITDEETNISKIAGTYDDVYLSECRREWHKLWDYFGVAEYKEKCFPSGSSKTKTLALITEEIEFLDSYFTKVCRKNQDKISTGKREVKSFLDKRKKNHSVEDLEDIEWAATNLYQIMRRRIVITEDIRNKFSEKTKVRSSIREKQFQELEDDLEYIKNKFIYKNEVLNIREQEMCAKCLCDEMKEVIDKWNIISGRMESLKKEKPDKYIEDFDGLLNDAIKRKK